MSKSNKKAASAYVARHIIPKQMGVTIFMKPTCPHSMNALGVLKELSGEKGFQVKVYDMNKDPNLYGAVKVATGKSTVPQIFYGNEYIGGNSDLMNIVMRVRKRQR